MRILLGHTFSDRTAFGSAWIEAWLARLRKAGFAVDPFSLVIDQHRPVIYFRELHILWRLRDVRLLAMYESLMNALSNYDAFICFTGANVHPEFVYKLDCFTVYGCFDDPESSHKLSKPVAAAFDLAMVGNVAELDTYRSWGVKEVEWWPLGFRHDDYDPSLSEQAILHGRRDIEVALLCERVSRYRRKRLDKFASAFPEGTYYGHGWPAGFLSENKRVPLLQRTRIGINMHNSTGPINFRTFQLPANGVMQICDNKAHLGKVFKLGEEVAGYDSIDEAIDLTRHYLKHDDERRRIAAAGWKRAISEYNEAACFSRVVDAIERRRTRVRHRSRSSTLFLSPGKSSKLNNLVARALMTIWIGRTTISRRTRGLVAAVLRRYR